MSNNLNKRYGSLPVYEEEYKMVKQKQLELTTKRGKIVPLVEIVNELVRKGINLIN